MKVVQKPPMQSFTHREEARQNASAFFERLVAQTTKLHNFEVLGELLPMRNEKKWYFSSRFTSVLSSTTLIQFPSLSLTERRWLNAALASHLELVTHSLFTSLKNKHTQTNKKKLKFADITSFFPKKTRTDLRNSNCWLACYDQQVIKCLVSLAKTLDR